MDFLSLTNKVLGRMNEVQLTASNFATARGYQIQCQNAVNEAINYINQREYGWPFSHATSTVTLVANQTRYSIPTTATHVDYETFRISKDNTLGVAGTTLRVLDYKQYIDRYVDLT